jgi:hypothetical protein
MGEYDHDPLSRFFYTDRRVVTAMLRREMTSRSGGITLSARLGHRAQNYDAAMMPAKIVVPQV